MAGTAVWTMQMRPEARHVGLGLSLVILWTPFLGILRTIQVPVLLIVLPAVQPKLFLK